MRQSLTALAFATTALILAAGSHDVLAQGTTAAPAATAAPPAVPQGTAKPRVRRKAAAAAPSGTAAPGASGATGPAGATTATEAPAKRQPSAAQKAQQDRMRTCNAEWKASGQTGRAAHKTFMSECLKKT